MMFDFCDHGSAAMVGESFFEGGEVFRVAMQRR
jgi:hypothetical protein